MPENNNTVLKVTLLILSFTFVYVLIRFVVIKGVHWSHIPLYITNKAFAWSASTLIVINFIIIPLSDWNNSIISKLKSKRPEIANSALIFSFLHIIISLVLFHREYFNNFFNSENTLSLAGELSMLSGLFTFIVLVLFFVNVQNMLSFQSFLDYFISGKRVGLVLLILLVIHISSMGFQNWFAPKQWPGYLPPVTLFAAIDIITGIFIILHFRNKTTIRKNKKVQP